jgi:hypothetical protein
MHWILQSWRRRVLPSCVVCCRLRWLQPCETPRAICCAGAVGGGCRRRRRRLLLLQGVHRVRRHRVRLWLLLQLLLWLLLLLEVVRIIGSVDSGRHCELYVQTRDKGAGAGRADTTR